MSEKSPGFGVHQVLAGAVRGDAVTNTALELRDLLRRSVPSEIFARHIAPDIAGEVRPLAELGGRGSHGTIVYHASIGEPNVTAFLLGRREPLVLVYHNITPARYFEPWDAEYAELLRLGRQELRELRRRVARCIAVSEFNAGELVELGYRDVKVIPPIVDATRLTRVEPDPLTLNHFDTVIDGPFVLALGQLLPHKRIDQLVEMMHVVETYLGIQLFLMIVGHTRFTAYADAIRQQLRELNLWRVHLVGGVDDAQLAAMFSRARGLVTLSEHEGFCVPLVEAMAFGVPTIARAAAAIPETLGGGGMLLPSNVRPVLAAEALIEVVTDDRLHASLAGRGAERLRGFDADRTRAAFVDAIAEVA